MEAGIDAGAWRTQVLVVASWDRRQVAADSGEETHLPFCAVRIVPNVLPSVFLFRKMPGFSLEFHGGVMIAGGRGR